MSEVGTLNIMDELRRNGATFRGGPRALPEDHHVCHCGKRCKSAQGLAVHWWKADGEHAPEHTLCKTGTLPHLYEMAPDITQAPYALSIHSKLWRAQPVLSSSNNKELWQLQWEMWSATHQLLWLV